MEREGVREGGSEGGKRGKMHFHMSAYTCSHSK